MLQGFAKNSGHQDMSIWGNAGGCGSGSISATFYQAEGLISSTLIPGGEIFNAHFAEQLAQIKAIVDPSVGGTNNFSGQTGVYLTPSEHGLGMGSANSANLHMDGTVNVPPSGAAGHYASQVILEGGHKQTIEGDGVKAFTNSHYLVNGQIKIGNPLK